MDADNFGVQNLQLLLFLDRVTGFKADTKQIFKNVIKNCFSNHSRSPFFSIYKVIFEFKQSF